MKRLWNFFNEDPNWFWFSMAIWLGTIAGVVFIILSRV